MYQVKSALVDQYYAYNVPSQGGVSGPVFAYNVPSQGLVSGPVLGL